MRISPYKIRFLPRPRWRGLSFALHRHGAGLLFCPAAIRLNASVYRAFCAVNAVIPPTPQNSAQSFTGAFQAICLVLQPLCGWCICLYCTACATLERITAPGRPPAHTRYHRHARTLHRSAQPPYYNKEYIRVQRRAPVMGP